MIYLDHPATSLPKPPCVIEAMRRYLEHSGGNPGRSGHRLSVAAGRVVYEARQALADFFGAPGPDRLIFAHNATHALNMVIQTVLRPGDAAVTTAAEHNSVMRPLRAMQAAGVELRIAPCSSTGEVDQDEFSRLVRCGTRLAVVNHAGNVTGSITPVAELARIAHEAGALVLVDAAQTAGVLAVDAAEMGADYIAFTGHKALQGPPGTGGLVLCTDRAADEIQPLIRGGTGSSSGSEEQPEHLPDRLEGGTPNGVGIAGLGAAVEWVSNFGLEKIRDHHDALMRRLVEGLSDIPGVQIFGPEPGKPRAPLVSFRVGNKSVSEAGLELDDKYAILSRVGLHCNPAAHRTMGTFPEGTVRFGVGPFTSEEDIRQAVAAVGEIASSG